MSTLGVEALDEDVEFALSSFRAGDRGEPTSVLALIVSAFLLALLFVVV